MFIAPITFKLSIQASLLGKPIVINLVYKSFKIASPIFMSPMLGVIPRAVSTTVNAHKESRSTSLTILMARFIPASIFRLLPFRCDRLIIRTAY